MGGAVPGSRRYASGNPEWSDAAPASGVTVLPAQFSSASLQPVFPTSQQSSRLGCRDGGTRCIVQHTAVVHRCPAPAAVWIFDSQPPRKGRTEATMATRGTGECTARLFETHR